MPIREQLTVEQKEWFAERLYTSQSGRVIVTSYLLQKYRRITDDYKTHNTIIKSRIIEMCKDFGI